MTLFAIGFIFGAWIGAAIGVAAMCLLRMSGSEA